MNHLLQPGSHLNLRREETLQALVTGRDFSRAEGPSGFAVGQGFSPAIQAQSRSRALAPAVRFSSQTAHPKPSERGLTLVELVVTVFILGILASAAVPIARFKVQRDRERELRYDLWQMRDAIDKYKDACDRGAFQSKVDSQCYPPDLNELIKGIDIQGKKVKFLRRIPVDPMTKKPEWGYHSMQDDPTSDSYGGQSVFDVYTKSTGTALDGTKYSEW